MAGTILVPVDGSLLSEAALPIASRLARGHGSTLHLLWVINPAVYPSAAVGLAPPAAPYAMPIVPGNLEELEKQQEDASRAYLEQLANRLAGPDLTVRYGLVEGVDPAPIIARQADELGVWLVIMSTHGRSGLSELIFGSTAKAVLAATARPVMLIRPPDEQRELEDAATLDPHPRILVPLDGTAHAEAALDLATEIAESLGGSLLLVAVVSRHAQSMPAWAGSSRAAPDDERVREARTYLESVARRIQGRGAEVETAVTVGYPWEQVVDTVEDRDAAMVVMVPFQEDEDTTDDDPSLGKVANAVLDYGAVPLVVVPARDLTPDPSPRAKRSQG